MKHVTQAILILFTITCFASSAWSWGFPTISVPKLHIPTISLPVIKLPSVPGINMPGIGKIDNFAKLPNVKGVVFNGIKMIQAQLAPQKMPNPAAYAGKAGAQLADQLWSDAQIKAMCTLSGDQCGPTLAGMIISTCEQDSDFKTAICGIFPKVGHNVDGFSQGFNSHLGKNINATQSSQPPNADFKKLGCN